MKIEDMINDELERLLETQGTKEYYDQPSGSGAITVMEATYPNPLTKDSDCATQSTRPPLLQWAIVWKSITGQVHGVGRLKLDLYTGGPSTAATTSSLSSARSSTGSYSPETKA